MFGFKGSSQTSTLFGQTPKSSPHLETQTGAFGTAGDLFGGDVSGPHLVMSAQPHRFSVPRLALLLTIGIVLGVALFLTVRSPQPNQRKRVIVAHATTEPMKLSVSVGATAAVGPVVERLPSLEEHIEGSPVTLAARRFLFAETSERAYGPEFVRGKFENRHADETQRLSRDQLQSLPGGAGRYTADSSIEWQGGFRHSDPASNSRLGQAYLDYLNGSVGDALGKKLSVINGERTNLLDTVTKTGRGPGDIRP
jgi:hypothetical protein